MRKLLLIIGVVILAVLTVSDVHEFLVTNEGVEYFASHPQRLLWVAGIAVLGGILAFAFSRLSASVRRRVKLWMLGGFAGFASCFVVFLVTIAAATPSEVTELGMWGWMGAVLCSAIALAILLWMEFNRLRRQRDKVPSS